MSKAKPEPDAPEKAKAELLGKGRYSIYQTPAGDGVISYRPDGEEADTHQVIPSRFWSVATKVLRGEMNDVNPMALLKMLAGGK